MKRSSPDSDVGELEEVRLLLAMVATSEQPSMPESGDTGLRGFAAVPLVVVVLLAVPGAGFSAGGVGS